MALPSTTDRRRERHRARIVGLREKLQILVQRARALRQLLEERWFDRDELESNNPESMKATGRHHTMSYIVIAALFAAWVIDRTVLRPTLEFILSEMSETDWIIGIGIYILPLVVIFIDLLVGAMVWGVLEWRSRGEAGIVLVTLWLSAAVVWVSMMPAFTIQAHRVSMDTTDDTELGWQLFGMVVLALAAHGGIVLAGEVIHDSLALRWFTWRHNRLSKEIRRIREQYDGALVEAVTIRNEYEHEASLFNRDNPNDPVSGLALDRASRDLLVESSAHDPSATTTPQPGSVN